MKINPVVTRLLNQNAYKLSLIILEYNKVIITINSDYENHNNSYLFGRYNRLAFHCNISMILIAIFQCFSLFYYL